MPLKEIFHKPIDRNIEGVIKADDDTSLSLELDEYVVTKEVEKRLDSFFDAYNNYQGANGTWISGFFGSGKSHLLKMLALLLENREVDGKTALEFFSEKPAFKDNEILRGDLKNAVAIPSRSILFNIDQKADVISKTEIDALLSVFVKVFNEECGYYGKQPYIASFERELDADGLLDDFKSKFKQVSNKDWEWARSRAKRFSSQVDGAYNQVTKQSVSQILDKYRNDYRLSIEDFAEQVLAYLNRKGPDFRLNFFVDEVGQYIADNVKLMTNLQTVAESLATKCKGRSWIIVTAQEDMSSVFGEEGKQQSNDYSKIIARFNNRMKLTSQDVAEVIQKRLLLKNEDGITQLSELYHTQSNNFKTLFDFADGSQTYRNFTDREHFIHSYPFIPYQFSLFQAAIQNLSTHNAFEGKHSSVGERSMLGVFQQVAVQISDYELGQLATFDLMFEGIRSTLKSQIQSVIIKAENNLENPFAIRVLKVLFLIKYVKEFKSTLRNVCVLMLEDFNQDIPALRKRVEAALNLLEQQTYIQRDGDQFDYLTNEEKDVEEEIKNTEVESTEVAGELSKIVFDHIIKDRKIRFDNGHDYAYTRKLDDRNQGREYELSINVITPFHEHSENTDILRTLSMARSELLVIMPPDDRLMRDLTLYKQTEKYIHQNISITQQDTVKRILESKGTQNHKREGEIQQRVQKLLGVATQIVAGADLTISGEDAKSRITRGFHELITRTYPNLQMLRGIDYKENDVNKYLASTNIDLLGNDATSLSEAEQELLSFINGNKRTGVRTTLKTLIEHFEKKPYGWYYAAILCILAMLCARAKVELRKAEVLEDAELEKAILNSRDHANIVLEPQVDFTASQVRGLKEFYSDFFDAPPEAREAKALANEASESLISLITEFQLLDAHKTQFPFLVALSPVLEKLGKISRKPYAWYITELRSQEDDLLDMKEQVIDPIRKFMGGSQKEIYKQASDFIDNQNANFIYIQDESINNIKALLVNPDCYKGDRVRNLKSSLESLKEKVNQKTVEIKTEKIDFLKAKQSSVQGMAEYKKLTIEQEKEINDPFVTLIAEINRQDLIPIINDRIRFFEDEGYQRLLSKMASMAAQLQTDKSFAKTSGGESSGAEQGGISEPKIEYVATRKIIVSYDKAWLASESDVEDYVERYKSELMELIRQGKYIQL